MASIAAVNCISKAGLGIMYILLYLMRDNTSVFFVLYWYMPVICPLVVSIIAPVKDSLLLLLYCSLTNSTVREREPKACIKRVTVDERIRHVSRLTPEFKCLVLVVLCFTVRQLAGSCVENVTFFSDIVSVKIYISQKTGARPKSCSVR